jgi:hypothetical protein
VCNGTEEEPINTELPIVGAAATRRSRLAPAAPKTPKASKRGRRAAEQVEEEKQQQEEQAQATPTGSKAATIKAATPKPATTAAEVLAAAKALRRTQQAVMVSRVEAAAAEALAVRKAAAREQCRAGKKLKRQVGGASGLHLRLSMAVSDSRCKGLRAGRMRVGWQAKAAEASHPFKVVALDRLHVTYAEHGTTPAVGFQKDRLFAKHTRSNTMLLPTTTKGPPFAFGR